MSKAGSWAGTTWCAALVWRGRSGATAALAALLLALGGVGGALAASGETPEVQGTTFLQNLGIGDAVIACLPGGECVDQGGALLKGFDPNLFAAPEEIGAAGALELDTTVEGTAFGGIEGRTVGSAAADQFCWTFPTPPSSEPAFRKPSGKLVCVVVRSAASCTSTSSPSSCGPAFCGNRSILLKAGSAGDAICRAVAQQMAQSITFGVRRFEMVIGFDLSRAGEQGSVTVATCGGFRPDCANPATSVANAKILNTIPLAAVDTPKLVRMGGLWCDTNTGKCFR